MDPSGAQVGRARLFGALGTGVLLAGSLTYIGLGDPHRPDFGYPTCPFRHVTGWNCPACGGLRMTHDVLHGDLAAAVVDNVFLLVGLPVLALWAVLRRRRGEPVLTKPVMAAIAVSAFVWTVVRNLPGFPLVPTMLSR
jgi:hypothetical protein